MQRLFGTLFFIIALTLVGVGWSIEAFWPDSEPPEQQFQWQQRLLANMASQLDGIPDREGIQGVLHLESQRLGVEFELMASGVMAWLPEQRQQLADGHSVLLFALDDSWSLYQPLASGEWLLKLSGKEAEVPRWHIYVPRLVGYAALALAILLWLYPLWRDLNRLKKSLNHYTEHNQSPGLSISPRSAIAPVFQAFEQMADQNQRLMAAQRDLSNAVSHELRTPLARLKFALVMLQGAPPERIKEMEQDVQELEALTNEMLRFSQLKSQIPELVFEPLDLIALISNKFEQLQKDDQHQLDWQLNGELTARCDGHFMERAIQNLLTNARRYASQHIKVTLSRQDGINCITVDDDGPGIPTEHQAAIFQPFVRLESGTRTGYGFGLAIVRQIMQWHGGDCRVSDSPSGGARFQLYW